MENRRWKVKPEPRPLVKWTAKQEPTAGAEDRNQETQTATAEWN